jgi:hypothetical protein
LRCSTTHRRAGPQMSLQRLNLDLRGIGTLVDLGRDATQPDGVPLGVQLSP